MADHGRVRAWQEHVAQVVSDRMTVEAMWMEDQMREAYALHEGSELALTVVDTSGYILGAPPVRSVASLWPQSQGEAP